jgi:hypothetical protein
MAASSTPKAVTGPGNQSSLPGPTTQSNSDVPAPDSITNGEKELPVQMIPVLKSTTSSPSSPDVHYTTLVSITLRTGKQLQVEVWDDYPNVVALTTSARGGSHWSWAGSDPKTGIQLARIVKIDEVQDIEIRPFKQVTSSAAS